MGLVIIIGGVSILNLKRKKGQNIKQTLMIIIIMKEKGQARPRLGGSF
jgi:hypothetical protein